MSTLNTHTYKIGRILKAHICIKCLKEFGKCARLWHTERTPWMRSFHWNAHWKYLLMSTIRRGKKNERKWHIREKNSFAANICTHELKSRTMNVFVFIVVARTDSGICLIKSNKKANSVAFQDITTEIEGFRMRFSVLLPFPFYLWRYTNFMWRKLIHFIRRIDKRQVLSHFDWTKQVGNSNVMIEFSKSYSYVLG